MFDIGDVVVCVNDADIYDFLFPIRVGSIYTIRECMRGKDHKTLEEGFAVRLEGIHNPDAYEGGEWCYVATRFQKIGDNPTDESDRETVENESFAHA